MGNIVYYYSNYRFSLEFTEASRGLDEYRCDAKREHYSPGFAGPRSLPLDFDDFVHQRDQPFPTVAPGLALQLVGQWKGGPIS